MGNSGTNYKDDRHIKRMDSVDNDYLLRCKRCAKLQEGKYFKMGSDFKLCADCDPKIITCKKCKHTKETSRFSKHTRDTGEHLCYNCEKGYTYVKKREYYGGDLTCAIRMRKCLKCDCDFKSHSNMRICNPCKLASKNIEAEG